MVQQWLPSRMHLPACIQSTEDTLHATAPLLLEAVRSPVFRKPKKNLTLQIHPSIHLSISLSIYLSTSLIPIGNLGTTLTPQ